jgi:hypothetical protein
MAFPKMARQIGFFFFYISLVILIITFFGFQAGSGNYTFCFAGLSLFILGLLLISVSEQCLHQTHGLKRSIS